MVEKFQIGDIPGHFYDGINCFWVCDGPQHNGYPFELLGVDKMDYCREILNYTPGIGAFPTCINMEDLRKVCKALDRDLSKQLGIRIKEKESEEELPEGHGFKVGDKVVITKGFPNFNSEMEKLVGKIVTITKIYNLDLKDCTIEFEGSSYWRWKFSQGHFKKYVPIEPLKEIISDIPDSYTFEGNGISYQTYTEKFEEHKGKWFWNSNVSNDAPFDYCNFNKKSAQQRLLGYQDDRGFPYCKSKEDLFKFCLLIDKERKAFYEKEAIPDIVEDSPKFMKIKEEEEEPGMEFYSPKGYIKGIYKKADDGTWYYRISSHSAASLYDECGINARLVQLSVLGYEDCIINIPYCKSKADLIKLCVHVHNLRKQFFEKSETVSTETISQEPKKSESVSPILIKVCKI